MTNDELIGYLEELVTFRDAEYSELCEFNRFSASEAETYTGKTDTIRSAISELKSSPDWKTQCIQFKADLENLKKRAARERADVINCAAKDIITDILPIIDGIERALEQAKSQKFEDNNPYIAGLKLTYHSLLTLLDNEGCHKIMSTRNTPFDPNIHNAVCVVNATDVKPGMICDVVRTGWYLNNKVLRAADVTVVQESASKQ